jgi:hypothetical protein
MRRPAAPLALGALATPAFSARAPSREKRVALDLSEATR